jgi:hypothetical protein
MRASCQLPEPIAAFVAAGALAIAAVGLLLVVFVGGELLRLLQLAAFWAGW